MKVFAFFLASFLMITCSCRKAAVVPGPEQSAYGYLRYSTIITDGPGLYYEKEYDTTAAERPDPATFVLLLSDGHGGALQDGERIDSLYHRYLNTRTLLSYRETGKKVCFGPIPVPCTSVPIIDTISFTLTP